MSDRRTPLDVARDGYAHAEQVYDPIRGSRFEAQLTPLAIRERRAEAIAAEIAVYTEEVNSDLDELDRLRSEIDVLHAYAARTDDIAWAQMLDALAHPKGDYNVLMLIEPDVPPV